jgi:hypothetical protein
VSPLCVLSDGSRAGKNREIGGSNEATTTKRRRGGNPQGTQGQQPTEPRTALPIQRYDERRSVMTALPNFAVPASCCNKAAPSSGC